MIKSEKTIHDSRMHGTSRETGIDPVVILSLISKNWYYIAIGLVVAMLCARFYMGHTMPVYESSVTLLVNETDDRSIAGNDELLKGLGLPGGMRNIDNQIMILTSRILTEKALKGLPFETEYYFKTFQNNIPVYPEIPVRIISAKENPLPKNIEFSITYHGNNKLTLLSESEQYPFKKTITFGDLIEMPGGTFSIEMRDEKWFTSDPERKLFFRINTGVHLVGYYNGSIKVEQLSRTGSMLKITLQGTNPNKDVDFLNQLAGVFQATSLDKKNIEAIRRIQFIDDQLSGISDSLSLTEKKLQQFRSNNKVMDLSVQGQAIIQQINLLESERARLNLEANYYDYLGDYLAKDLAGELPIVPVTMGITDPGLTRLVTELSVLQGQLLARGAGERNPLQNLLMQKVRNTKDGLIETLNGLKRANNLAKSDNQEQINKVNSQAAALPSTERQLLGIERKFKLNDEMYTFLLETRAEQQMQKASNISDSEVIDPADVSFCSIVSPNRNKIYFIGFISGTGIPFVIIFLLFVFNKKLKEEDIPKLTDIPSVGDIPHNTEKGNNVVFDSPNSSISEAYRLMRSRMQFFIKDTASPAILVTSTMPGEGKTFTAINLASAYSILGKRTVLVGFDLRKPKIYQDFNLNNGKGISTYLIGENSAQDIIFETSSKNLWIIPAGPIPPNPSELTSLKRTDDLFKILKEKFEIIIIDSSPVGLVSDSMHLATLSDVCIMVVRPGYTLKDIFGKTIEEMKSYDVKNLSLVINDLQIASNYRYSEKYGYTNAKKELKSTGKKTGK